MKTRLGMRVQALGGILAWTLGAACGGDGNEADRVGIASLCAEDEDCPVVGIGEDEVQLACLTQFSGGYCSVPDCESALDCPEGSLCVAHEDGENYCFRACRDKSECNRNRPPDDEANCSANFDYAEPSDDTSGEKACIPPSSG